MCERERERDLPVIRISPERVMSPVKGMTNGRIATLASGRACLG